MRVHPSPSKTVEWYSRPFVPRYWNRELEHLRYGLGNFYSIDGFVSHAHNWYDRVPKIADPESKLTTESDGDGLPVEYISLATARFLEDHRAGTVVLPDPAQAVREARAMTEHVLRFDVRFAERHAHA